MANLPGDLERRADRHSDNAQTASPEGRPAGVLARLSRSSLSTLREWRVTACVLALIVFVVLDSSRRRPIDPNQPIVLHDESRAIESNRQSIRFGTFNIRGGRGRDEVRDLARTVRTLENLDFIGLQEVHGSPVTGSDDQCLELGDAMDHAAMFVPTERRWGGNNFGNGLLTRVPLLDWQRMPLPSVQDKRYRNVLLSTVPLGDRTVRVLVTHLDNQKDHDHQLAGLIRLFLSLEEPAVLMGDLNTGAKDRQFQQLLAHPSVTVAIGEKLPDGRRLREVDWILARGLRCISSETRDLNASDHPAIVAELALPVTRTASNDPLK